MLNPFRNSIHFVFLIDVEFLSTLLIEKFHYSFSNPNNTKLSFPGLDEEMLPSEIRVEAGHEPGVIVLRLFPLVEFSCNHGMKIMCCVLHCV